MLEIDQSQNNINIDAAIETKKVSPEQLLENKEPVFLKSDFGEIRYTWTTAAILTKAKIFVEKDNDYWIVVDGKEGSGKSTLAAQIGYYLYHLFTGENKFPLEQVCFTTLQFVKAIDAAKKYDVIIWDEAATASSRNAMSLVNKTLNAVAAEVRQKNLFLIVVLPTFFELEKYVAVHRSRLLLHCIQTNEAERGIYTIYPYEKKKDMYLLGRKKYDYAATKPIAVSTFTEALPFDREEYRARKAKAFKNRIKQAIEKLKYIEGELLSEVSQEGIAWQDYLQQVSELWKLRTSAMCNYLLAQTVNKEVLLTYLHKLGLTINTYDFDHITQLISPDLIKKAIVSTYQKTEDAEFFKSVTSQDMKLLSALAQKQAEKIEKRAEKQKV